MKRKMIFNIVIATIYILYVTSVFTLADYMMKLSNLGGIFNGR